jgi:hypothetical protein
MAWGISGDGRQPRIFVVECKRCARNIPANVDVFPKDNIRVDCPLCGEKRRYRPTEVYLGWADLMLGKQHRNMSEHYRFARGRRKVS